MKFPNFVGPAYTGQSKNATVDELINMFVERIEVPGSGKNDYVLYKRPGYLLVNDTTLPIILQCPSPDPVIAVAYEFQMSATGGKPPYIWQLIAGAFPTGISMDTSGLISGTALESGTFSFTIQVIDTEGKIGTIDCMFDIAEPGELIILQCPNTNPVIDEPYEFQMEAAGGVPPYTWELLVGPFPDGITIDSDGLISGTATESGTFPWTVQVTDSDAVTATIDCSFDVPASVDCFRPLSSLDNDDAPYVNPERTNVDFPELANDVDGACGESTTTAIVRFRSSTIAAHATDLMESEFPEPNPPMGQSLTSVTVRCTLEIWNCPPQVGPLPVIEANIYNVLTHQHTGEVGYPTEISVLLQDVTLNGAPLWEDIPMAEYSATYTPMEFNTNFGGLASNIYLRFMIWSPTFVSPRTPGTFSVDNVSMSGTDATYQYTLLTGFQAVVGNHVTVTGCVNSENDGTFKITAVSSSGPLTFTVTNASGVNEASSTGTGDIITEIRFYVADCWVDYTYA